VGVICLAAGVLLLENKTRWTALTIFQNFSILSILLAEEPVMDESLSSHLQRGILWDL